MHLESFGCCWEWTDGLLMVCLLARVDGVADLASENADFQSLGLPLLNEADEPTCGFDRACTRAGKKTPSMTSAGRELMSY